MINRIESGRELTFTAKFTTIPSRIVSFIWPKPLFSKLLLECSKNLSIILPIKNHVTTKVGNCDTLFFQLFRFGFTGRFLRLSLLLKICQMFGGETNI